MCNDSKTHETLQDKNLNRRGFLKAGVAGAATVATVAATGKAASAAQDPYAVPAKPGLPPSDMKLDLKRTALVVTDPQIDFLSPDGVTWGVVGESVQHHQTVGNLKRLFEAAKQVDMTVAVSPHYYYPTDKGWKFEGALEKLMHNVGMWKIVYLMPEAAFVKNVANLSPVSVIADMIEEDRDRIINEPPEASFSIMPEKPTAEDIVILVSTSSDPDGDELTYSWYIDDEFVSGAEDSPDWEWVAPEPGKYKITLVVNDGRGGTAKYSATVVIGGGGIGTGIIIGIVAGLVVILLIFIRFRVKQQAS